MRHGFLTFRSVVGRMRDVELTQVQLRSFAEHLPAFQLTVAKFTSKLQVPVFCELLAFERLSSFMVVRRFLLAR